jgi:hypothetical protein
MSWMALATEGLIVLAMLAGVMAILALHRRQFGVLALWGGEALHFPLRMGEIAFIAVVGAVLGLALGTCAVPFVSYMITQANRHRPCGRDRDERTAHRRRHDSFWRARVHDSAFVSHGNPSSGP